jgi:hypothetical protein
MDMLAYATELSLKQGDKWNSQLVSSM